MNTKFNPHNDKTSSALSLHQNKKLHRSVLEQRSGYFLYAIMFIGSTLSILFFLFFIRIERKRTTPLRTTISIICDTNKSSPVTLEQKQDSAQNDSVVVLSPLSRFATLSSHVHSFSSDRLAPKQVFSLENYNSTLKSDVNCPAVASALKKKRERKSKTLAWPSLEI